MWRRPNDPSPVSPEPEPLAAPSAPAPRREEHAPPAAHAPDATRISQGISIRGEIIGRQDLLIDGDLQGSVHLEEARVTIGTNGRLKADVAAAEIVVEGQVNGNLTARNRVIIRRSGRVYGSVLSPRLAIEEGAVINGEVDMARPGESSAAPPASGTLSAFRAAAP
jgi:cytoskeletal protein CcmA (bactofilin family)